MAMTEPSEPGLKQDWIWTGFGLKDYIGVNGTKHGCESPTRFEIGKTELRLV